MEGVDAFDVLEQVLVAGRRRPGLDALGLEVGEEVLHRGVVAAALLRLIEEVDREKFAVPTIFLARPENAQPAKAREMRSSHCVRGHRAS